LVWYSVTGIGREKEDLRGTREKSDNNGDNTAVKRNAHAQYIVVVPGNSPTFTIHFIVKSRF
jgi:hypothetical protein